LALLASLSTCFGGKMRFTLIILGCLAAFSVFAANTEETDSEDLSINKKNVYKCVESTGKKDYQSTPCKSGNVNSTLLNIKTGGYTNLDEEKKQQESKQQGEQAKLEEQKLTKQQQIEKQASIDKEAIAESAKNQELVKSDSKQFSAYAIPPYQPDKLPDLVQNYRARLADIERLRRTAAEKALSSNQCGRVEEVALDAKSTKTLLAFLINCGSGKAFYYTEEDLKK
jgi:hypothetical protein